MLQKHIFPDGSVMYFDAVLDADMEPLFNSTPEEVAEWLVEHAADSAPKQVCVGETMELLSIDDYLRQYDESTRR